MRSWTPAPRPCSRRPSISTEGTKSAQTEEVAPGILLDFDANARAIGIEDLDVRERLGVLHFGAPRPFGQFLPNQWRLPVAGRKQAAELEARWW
jgi:Protein of unknown function (DUF2283)